MLPSLNIGLLHVFIQHTSASLSINENADPDVRRDMELALTHLVPENLDYVHTAEGLAYRRRIGRHASTCEILTFRLQFVHPHHGWRPRIGNVARDLLV